MPSMATDEDGENDVSSWVMAWRVEGREERLTFGEKEWRGRRRVVSSSSSRSVMVASVQDVQLKRRVLCSLVEGDLENRFEVKGTFLRIYFN